MSKKKNRVNVVYSTNPDFSYEEDQDDEMETLAPEKQQLKVWIDKKQRAGKEASIVKGFVGTESDLKDLAKKIKQACGTGGSVKDGEIIIQGDKRDAIIAMLTKEGYKAKKAGG